MSIIIMIGAVSGIYLLTEILTRYPQVGLGLAFGSTVLLLEFPRLPALVSVSSVTAYPQDVLIICMFFAAIRNFRARYGRLETVMAAAFVIVAMASLVLGMSEHGVAQAFNEFRAIFWVFATLAWAMSLTWTRSLTRQLGTLMLITGWLLVIAAATHLMLYGLGSAGDSRLRADCTRATSRILVSGQSMVLLICLLAQLHALIIRPRLLSGLSSMVFLGMIMLSQNRSVWVASVVAIGLLAIVMYQSYAQRVTACVGFGVTLVIVAIMSGKFGALGSVIAESAQSNSTYESRTTGWGELWSKQVEGGPVAILFGQTFGTGYARIDINGQLVAYAPHNWYVLILLRVGVLGLAVYVYLLIAVAYKLSRQHDSSLQLAIWFALIVYGWAYSIEWYMAPIIGWCIATAYSSNPGVRRRARGPHFSGKASGNVRYEHSY